jgi:hypothetical protein
MMRRNCEKTFENILISFLILLCIFRRALYDRRISQEVSGEDLGDEFSGYVRYFVNR